MDAVPMNTNHHGQRPIAIAPIQAGSVQQTTSELAPVMPFTCVTCTKRKVKCDKTGPPCSTCKKGRHECQYEAPPPRKRKRKQVEDVQEKIERYESLLRQHGLIDPVPAEHSTVGTGNEQPNTALATPDSTDDAKPTLPSYPGQVPQPRPGKMLAGHGKSRYIDSTLWHTLSEQQMNPSDDEEEEEASENDCSNQHHNNVQPAAPAMDPLTASVFNPRSQHINLVNLHPPYEQAMKLWEVFTTHVEPITKTFHLPTAQTMMQLAASSPGTITKTTECLVFSVYFFAVVAMSEAECLHLTGQPQQMLWSRYHDATRQALVNAHFLRTTEKNVLQAYALFLLAARFHYDTRTFWILTGVAIRIAQRLGLHRDGSEFGLKPFDAEMRRRLFWQLLPLEGMAAQMCGGAMALPYDWNTHEPSNLNDSDLHPDMPSLPPNREGATDMILPRVRAEMGKFHARERPFQGEWEQLWQRGDHAMLQQLEDEIDALQDRLETKYLRYCDFVIPSHCLAMAMARGTPCMARLRLRLPKARIQTLTLPERTELCTLALRILDYTITARTNPLVRRFNWHLQAYFQWEPVIWILNELRKGGSSSSQTVVLGDVEGVWKRFRSLYAEWPEFVSARRTLYVAVAKLMVKAWDVRPEGMRLEGVEGEGVEPEFIGRLRGLVRSKSAVSRAGIEGSVGKEPRREESDSFVLTDSGADAAVGNDERVSGEGVGDEFHGFLDDSPPDIIDWNFWDELIKDPDAWKVS
ncbi:hypothetical protein KC332_g305 [Hortaea werneckii]|uniref:Zn(2)-C6 fungal-type domain-containing protein n=2 Tax=Hortaea werneckii TaxID=91943 RepID=A0A3M7ITE6_HORWE|nr:hypothetical protein KC358_g425 [Hortaea werneckii]OTA23607.1 hypothetical protein BTJ68_13981 [Hortaea werneckii EXF-2000]KAI6852878.1 hypothetical protein KC350_g474 [Hortaea werneckii]KAI6944798.1 hypothetical protein KC341_g551 [Hortaea werneckii]KAI6950955.1 hypothetical protein KC348_g332 [Hortaea werneckii]